MRKLVMSLVAVAALAGFGGARAQPSNVVLAAGIMYPQSTAGQTITIKQGQTVEFVNADPAVIPHSMTADDLSGGAPLFDSGRITTGVVEVTSVASLPEGTYKFHCVVHSNMHGTLVVNSAY